MAIGIFLKHLFTGIRRRPAQPILLIIVMSLAITVCMIALDIGSYLSENTNGQIEETYGTADYAVIVSSVSNSRFILADDAKALLPEGVDSCGVYGLPTFVGDEQIFAEGAATIFEDANKIFNFYFIEYTPIKREEISHCVYITKDFAEEHNFTLGSKMKISILGYSREYTVCGIASKYFMAKYDLMVDTSSLVEMISNDSIFLNSLEGFCPCSQYFIDLNGMDVSVLEPLQEYYSYMSVQSSDDSGGAGLQQLDQVISIMEVFSVFFITIVIYCCFHVLSSQRNEENLLFDAAGCNRYSLDLLSAFELFLYWAIGMIVGTLLTFPVAEKFIAACDFRYTEVSFHLYNFLLAGLLALGAAEFSLCLSVIVRKTQKKSIREKEKESAVKTENDNVKPVERKTAYTILTSKGMKIAFYVVLAVVGVVATIFASISNYDNQRFVCSIVGFFALTFFAFFFGRFLQKEGARALSKSKRISIPFRYALKNSYAVGLLGNISGIFCILLIVFMVLTIAVSTGNRAIEKQTHFIKCDYLVINASEGATQNLSELDGIEGAYKMFNEYVDIAGKKIMVVSADSADAFHSYTRIDSIPEGNNAYLCGMYLEDTGLTVGEDFEIFFGNKSYTLHLQKTIDYVGNFLVINSDYFDLPCNYIGVRAVDGWDLDLVYEAISSELMFESASIVETSEFNRKQLSSSISFTNCGYFIMFFTLIFSPIGIGDTIVASYKSRKNQFFCYYTAGMSKSGLRKMKLYETAFALLAGLVSFIIVAPSMFMVMEKLMESFNVNFFWVFS